MLNFRSIPEFLYREWMRRDVVRRFVRNSGWSLVDQGWRGIVAAVVGLWTARYLGPAQLGDLAFAAAWIGLLSPLANLGLNSLVLRDLVREGPRRGEILGTALALKIAGSFLLWGVVAVVIALGGAGTTERAWLLAIAVVGPLFQAADVVDIWFQADADFVRPSLVRMAVATLLGLARVVLILAGAPLQAFAVASSAELAVLALGWWWAARSRRSGAVVWSWSGSRARRLLVESTPLMLGTLAVMVQAQFDQVLMGRWLPAEDLGRYAAVLRLVTLVVVVHGAAQAAAAPEIARAHAADPALFRRRLHDLNRLMVGLSLLIAAPFVVAPTAIVRLCYGESYVSASAWLPWLTLRLLLAGLGMSRSLFLANAGLLKLSAWSALVGAVLSLLLNVLLIPRVGVSGAIAAGLISLTVTTLVVDWFHPEARGNVGSLWKAIVTPWRPLR